MVCRRVVCRHLGHSTRAEGRHPGRRVSGFGLVAAAAGDEDADEGVYYDHDDDEDRVGDGDEGLAWEESVIEIERLRGKDERLTSKPEPNRTIDPAQKDNRWTKIQMNLAHNRPMPHLLKRPMVHPAQDPLTQQRNKQQNS